MRSSEAKVAYGVLGVAMDVYIETICEQLVEMMPGTCNCVIVRPVRGVASARCGRVLILPEAQNEQAYLER